MGDGWVYSMNAVAENGGTGVATSALLSGLLENQIPKCACTVIKGLILVTKILGTMSKVGVQFSPYSWTFVVKLLLKIA